MKVSSIAKKRHLPDSTLSPMRREEGPSPKEKKHWNFGIKNFAQLLSLIRQIIKSFQFLKKSNLGCLGSPPWYWSWTGRDVMYRSLSLASHPAPGLSSFPGFHFTVCFHSASSNSLLVSLPLLTLTVSPPSPPMRAAGHQLIQLFHRRHPSCLLQPS